MEKIGERDFSDKGVSWYKRNAMNLRNAQAVVLVGAKRAVRGVSNCGYYGFGDCVGCKKAGGTCAFVTLGLGIVLSSSMCTTTDAKVDNRVMLSIGRPSEEMDYLGEDVFGSEFLWALLQRIYFLIEEKSIDFYLNLAPSITL